jgi:hypothetical protein
VSGPPIHSCPGHSRGTRSARQTPPVAHRQDSSSLHISQQDHSVATLHHCVPSLSSANLWEPQLHSGYQSRITSPLPPAPTAPQSFCRRHALPARLCLPACACAPPRHASSCPPRGPRLDTQRMSSPTTSSIGRAFLDSTPPNIPTTRPEPWTLETASVSRACHSTRL